MKLGAQAASETQEKYNLHKAALGKSGSKWFCWSSLASSSYFYLTAHGLFGTAPGKTSRDLVKTGHNPQKYLSAKILLVSLGVRHLSTSEMCKAVVTNQLTSGSQSFFKSILGWGD